MAKSNKTNGYMIEKGVPVPAKHAGRGYPWPQMKAGDSVFIPNKHSKTADISALNWAQRNGRKFTTHKEANGVRIWRVA